MSREIRRVPMNWQHPVNESTGHFVPLFDGDYDEVAQRWLEDLGKWEAGEDDHRTAMEAGGGRMYWWEADGGPPQREWYRPIWTQDELKDMGYAMYETVSEGTPRSPVFRTLSELEDWIVERLGYSREAALRFTELGWAPSMTVSRDKGGVAKVRMNLDALEPG